MTTYYHAYGARASSINNHTQIAGRYGVQELAEKRIVPDILHKLDLQATDNLLEIGCGTGNLLIPMSFICRSVTGIDHPSCLDKLTKRYQHSGQSLVAGNFLDVDLITLPKFEKILVYSVLHCLADEGEVFDFIDKALKLLKPGGRLLLGDIPNKDRKNRFLSSQAGADFLTDWNEQVKQSGIDEPAFEAVTSSVGFDDQLVLQILAHVRRQNCESYVCSQPCDLPFGNTREDIIVQLGA
ncbi:class I SAM-dependent methyltransferase [Motilimonas sp. E26]|uniref:class I SAM-dependent methyltransferase n=1 Tax=Motilimonas sp. E26 TaxID=2865674 RepID=UPI001E4AC131|nr:class I SAM-dependent methyltransferase [Motilimonas sp. E26]MCE0556214.1 class I SAM-dependent methyltransferase [Motilimonas sp. E26]